MDSRVVEDKRRLAVSERPSAVQSCWKWSRRLVAVEGTLGELPSGSMGLLGEFERSGDVLGA